MRAKDDGPINVLRIVGTHLTGEVTDKNVQILIIKMIVIIVMMVIITPTPVIMIKTKIHLDE